MKGTPAFVSWRRSSSSFSLTGRPSKSGTPEAPLEPLEGRQGQVGKDVLDVPWVHRVLSRHFLGESPPCDAVNRSFVDLRLFVMHRHAKIIAQLRTRYSGVQGV
jgi:hypothetical protein